MKKFILFLTVILTLSISFFPFAINADVYADTGYLRVITNDTPFYKNSGDTSPLFYLPYTYYVKVIEDGDKFVHVEWNGDKCAAIDGYVPKDALFNDNLSVTDPFAFMTIKTSTNAVLYSDSDLNTAIQYVFPDRDMFYYGTYTGANGNLYYVSYNGKLGYVKEAEVYPFTLPNHPNELTFIEPTEPTVPPVEEENNSITATEDFFSLKIIIIVCLLFAGLVALFVALKGKPKKATASGYYDENEYE